MATRLGVVFDWGWLAVFRITDDLWSVWIFNERYLLKRKVYWWAKGR